MRLIDADALFQKVPYGDIEHDVKISKCGAIADICTWILTAPTIDAVPVVRCKDCKHFVQSEPYDPCECMKWTVKWGVAYTQPDAFCSYGERRSDD